MSSDGSQGNRTQLWLYPVLILGSTAAIVFVGFFLVDYVQWRPDPQALRDAHLDGKPSALAELFTYDVDTAQNALGNLAQVITAVLGIVITVVSIVVQLAATRYTPRIAEMFFRDRTNFLVLGYFVVAGIVSVWVSLSVSKLFVPQLAITATLVMVTLSVLLMFPYFAYVFDFLDPEKVVARIQVQALHSAVTGQPDESIVARQDRVLQSIEQLGDVAMNAVAQKDKLIAQGAVDALKSLAVDYLSHKNTTAAAWFEVGTKLRKNPDFVSMSPDSVDRLAAHRVWLEWKVLRQYQGIFNEALGEMPELTHLVAIDTRYVGEAALGVGDEHALALAVKFFNTYLRAALNADQIRTAYNTFNQYRQLMERVTESPIHNSLAVEVAGYFRYYSQIAHSKGLGFLTETAAYDLSTLCEHAATVKAACHDELLKVLLTLDRAAETVETERMLRGVRKAQAKLAAFYLANDDEAHARMIFEDMKCEPVARLTLIQGELLRVSSKEFWEVSDRGTNFDYMDDQRKEHLKAFFSWFPTLEAPSTAVPLAVAKN